ncbi:hypothetical protein V494_07732 [Pseudogymnoascus sp. VKM F-4513 (FW-928)]|nr:hypothetical protein V494_07732 [Pseudogymnoascus sp. VKM F-4513 (FW-928)]
MQMNYLFAVGLLPELLAAAAVPVRRDVSCSFSVAPSVGATCESFAGTWGISVDQFQTLNPDAQCPDLDTSKNYCVIGTVTTPTGTTAPTSTAAPPTSTKATSTTAPPTTTSQAPSGPSPTMPGIVAECDQFYKIASGDQCDTIEVKFGISDNDFKTWNSETNSDCTNLWLDYYVCVHVPGATTTEPGTPTPTNGPTPQMPGIVAECDGFHKVASGDQCDTIESQYGISDSDFKTWNSETDAECTNLWLDYYVCVHVPGATTTAPATPTPTNSGPTPQMPGVVAECKTFHKVVSGEGCDKIEPQYNITLDQLRKWNTQLDSTCTNLWADYYICVGV